MKLQVGIEGLEFIKPCSLHNLSTEPPQVVNGTTTNDEQRKGRSKQEMQNGLDVEVLFGLREDEAGDDMHMRQWAIKRVKSGIKKPVGYELNLRDLGQSNSTIICHTSHGCVCSV